MTLPGGVLWEHTQSDLVANRLLQSKPLMCVAAGSAALAMPVLHPTTSASTLPEGHWDLSGSFYALENLTPNQEIKKSAQISPLPRNLLLNRLKIQALSL